MSATGEQAAKHAMPAMPEAIGNSAWASADPPPHTGNPLRLDQEHEDFKDAGATGGQNTSHENSEAGSDLKRVEVLTLRPDDGQYGCESQRHHIQDH